MRKRLILIIIAIGSILFGCNISGKTAPFRIYNTTTSDLVFNIWKDTNFTMPIDTVTISANSAVDGKEEYKNENYTIYHANDHTNTNGALTEGARNWYLFDSYVESKYIFINDSTTSVEVQLINSSDLVIRSFSLEPCGYLAVDQWDSNQFKYLWSGNRTVECDPFGGWDIVFFDD